MEEAPAPTETGFKEHVGAIAGLGCTLHVSPTLLLKPFDGLTVIVDVVDCPAFNTAVESAAEREKSGGTELKVADTVRSEERTRLHCEVPEQPPAQPAKSVDEALSVSSEPEAKL